MTIAQDLKALNKDIQSLGKTLDRLLKAVEKDNKSKAKPTKQIAAKKAPAKKAATKKAASKPAKPSKLDITPEERWKMIAIAAYHKAEKRGFAPGKELQDWAEAEKEISKLLLG